MGEGGQEGGREGSDTDTDTHTHSPLAGERLAAADLVVVVGRGREEERKNGKCPSTFMKVLKWYVHWLAWRVWGRARRPPDTHMPPPSLPRGPSLPPGLILTFREWQRAHVPLTPSEHDTSLMAFNGIDFWRCARSLPRSMTDSSKARAQSAWEKHTNALAATSSPLPRCVVPCVA